MAEKPVYTFKDSAVVVQEIKRFLSNESKKQIFTVYSKYLLLSKIKVFQVLTISSKNKDKYIFLDHRILCEHTDSPFDLINPFISGEKDYLIIKDENHELGKSEQSLALLKEIFQTLSQHYRKKLIIIIYEELDDYTEIIPNSLFVEFAINQSEKYIAFTDDANKFSDLTSSSQDKLLTERRVKFQGQEIRLNQLIGIHDSNNLNDEDSKDVDSILDSSTLINIIRNDEIKIGRRLSSYDFDHPFINVKRTLQRKTKMRRLHLEEDKDDLFVISGVSKSEFLKQAPCSAEEICDFKDDTDTKEHVSIVIMNNEAFEDRLNQLCEVHPEKDVHWLKAERGALIWKKTHGTLCGLRKFLISGECDSYELNLTHFTDELVIISADSRMGKSTVLTRLSEEAKQSDPSFWIIKIKLQNYKEQIKKADFQDLGGVVNFLTAIDDIENPLTKSVMTCRLKRTGRIAVLLDGYDKVQCQVQRQVTELIKTLKSKAEACKVWITTHSDRRNELEDVLETFAYTLKPLEQDAKKMFLQKFWEESGSDVKYPYNYAGEILEGVTDDCIKNMSLLRMIASAFPNECNSDQKYDLLDLYDFFVRSQYMVFLSDCQNLSPYLRSLLIQSLTKAHRSLAFEGLFPNDTEVIQLLKVENICEKEIKDIGVFRSMGEKQVTFHEQCAEYFAADSFVDLLKKDEKHPEHKIVRQFLLKEIFKDRNKTILEFMKGRVRKGFDADLKRKWNIIEECVLLRDTDICPSPSLRYSEEYNVPKESLEKLKKLVESCMKGSVDEFSYWENNHTVIFWEKLFFRYFYETNLVELKKILEFLQSVNGNSLFFKANMIIAENINEAMQYYEEQYKLQNKRDTSFEEPIQRESTEHSQETKSSNFNIPQSLEELLQSESKIFGGPHFTELSHSEKMSHIKQCMDKRYCHEDFKWLEREGMKIATQSKILTPEMSRKFHSTLYEEINNGLETGFHCLYASNIITLLIIPFLDMMEEQELPNVDEAGFIDILLHTFEFSVNHVFYLNTNHLRKILKLMESALDKNHECGWQALSQCVRILIPLSKRGLKLINIDPNLLVLDPKTEFQYSLLSSKEQIVELVTWKDQNPKLGNNDFEQKCKEVARKSRRRKASFDSPGDEIPAKSARECS